MKYINLNFFFENKYKCFLKYYFIQKCVLNNKKCFTPFINSSNFDVRRTILYHSTFNIAINGYNNSHNMKLIFFLCFG